jgi:glycosyltransferase involved in cell wall biosynthesis
VFVHTAVIVPAFNVAEFLPDAIRSVLGQTHTDWSLVVVDDGSTDATAMVASAFRDNRIGLIPQSNTGVSSARNTGLAAAMARTTPPDAVLFLDADDWLAPDALLHLAEALHNAPRAVASVGRFARVRANEAPRIAPRPPRGDLLERLLVRNLFANGGHLLIRQSAIAAAGNFRSDLTYGEDWEYWARLARFGEFVPACSAGAQLFVRERLDGAYLSRATDPDAYRPALVAIHSNPGLAERLGTNRLGRLARQSDAEVAWTVGRERIRHGCRRDGLRWVARSIRAAPSVKRLTLLGLIWLGRGPFRPYSRVGPKTKR